MLKSTWSLALLGIVLGIATTVGVVLLNKEALLGGSATPAPHSPGPANAPRDWVFWTDEITHLAGNLKEERASLDERAEELDQFEKRLVAEKEELDKVRVELEGMRREVTENIPKIEASERQNVKNLAKTYSAMNPQDAVMVMREMDDSSIVKILASMKADMVGSIFKEMAKAKDADGTLSVRAARLSEQLRLVQNEAKAVPQP